MQSALKRIVSGLMIAGALAGAVVSNADSVNADFRVCGLNGGPDLQACALHNTGGTLIGSSWYQRGITQHFLGAFDHVAETPTNWRCDASVTYVNGLPVFTTRTTAAMIGQQSAYPVGTNGWYNPIGANTTPQNTQIN
jgi:hypothetical protein